MSFPKSPVLLWVTFIKVFNFNYNILLKFSFFSINHILDFLHQGFMSWRSALEVIVLPLSCSVRFASLKSSLNHLLQEKLLVWIPFFNAAQYPYWYNHWKYRSLFVLIIALSPPRTNYVNPVCCVATVCHQVRCMYWGHLGHFHIAISHLKWYKIVCMRYLACIFSQTKSIYMFPMFLQSGVLRHSLSRFIAVWI